jgi:F-box-like
MSLVKIQMLPDPPTKPSRIEAHTRIENNRKTISSLTERIQSAEHSLAQIVEESRRNIEELKNERSQLEQDVSLALAYISPIRTLPHELLRHIFMLNFEDHPCCAWGLAAVCSLWRKLVLLIPRLWSKVNHLRCPPTKGVKLWSIFICSNGCPMHTSLFFFALRACTHVSFSFFFLWRRSDLLPPQMLVQILFDCGLSALEVVIHLTLKYSSKCKHPLPRRLVVVQLPQFDTRCYHRW